MKRLLPWVIVLGVGIISILPLTYDGYFPMHDDTQVARVIEMGRALRQGQFPVRWVGDLGFGYGYPLFNFYGPLPYYLGGVLYALGMPALLATKMMFAVGVVGAALVMYGVISSLVGWQAGMLASILYLFAPYHAVQIYVRGAVGEYWTLAFWPLLLLGFWGNQRSDRATTAWMLGSFGLAGAILSHTILGYVTTVFLILGLGLYWVVRWIIGQRERSWLVRHAKTLVFGLGLSAFFWLPALYEMRYTSVAGQVSETANVSDHFVCWAQLWSSLWGFAGSAPGCIDGMSFMIGKLHLIVSGITLAGWLMIRPKKNWAIVILGITISLVGLFFATPTSEAVWSVLPGFRYVQYPWRFLAVVNLGIALLGAGLVLLIPGTWKKTITAFALGILIVAFNAKWFVPQYTYQKQNSEFEDAADLRWRVSKISDEYLPDFVPRPKDASQIVSSTIAKRPGLIVTPFVSTFKEERFIVASTASGELTLYKAHFPGWRYYVNDIEVTPRMVGGLPNVILPAGQSTLTLQFTNTPVRQAGNMVSIVSFVLLVAVYYEKHKKTND